MGLVQETIYIKIKEPGYLPISTNQTRDTPNITKNPESKETSCALSEQKAPTLCNALQPNCDLKCLKHNLINCRRHKQETREIFLSWLLKLNRISAAGQRMKL